MQTNVETIEKEAYKRGWQEARVAVAMLWWKAGDMTHRIIRNYSLDEEEQELFYTAIRKVVAEHDYPNWVQRDTEFAFKRMVRRGYPLQKIEYYLGISCKEVERLWELHKDDCQDEEKIPAWHMSF